MKVFFLTKIVVLLPEMLYRLSRNQITYLSMLIEALLKINFRCTVQVLHSTFISARYYLYSRFGIIVVQIDATVTLQWQQIKKNDPNV